MRYSCGESEGVRGERQTIPKPLVRGFDPHRGRKNKLAGAIQVDAIHGAIQVDAKSRRPVVNVTLGSDFGYPIDSRLPSIAVVYLLHAPELKMVKIGVSSNVADRVFALRQANAAILDLLCVLSGGKDEESALQARFGEHRRRGEWFVAVPGILGIVRDRWRDIAWRPDAIVGPSRGGFAFLSALAPPPPTLEDVFAERARLRGAS